MRIVYVLTSLGMGGAERQVLTLASRMAERGHGVAIMVLRPPIPEEWPTNLQVVHLNMHRSFASVLAGYLHGRKFLIEFHPDLLHSHSFHANFVARLLRIAAPFAVNISTIHNVYEGGWRRMLAYRLTDLLSWRTTAVSAAVAERFIELKAVPKLKCVVITNGIDTNEFNPDAMRRARMRSSMNAGNAFIWLAAGRIVPAKDIPNLLRAFAMLRSTEQHAQLWIAGESSGSKTVSSVGIESETEKSEGVDGVRWLGLRRDLAALMDAADGFVLSSAWEGMPLVLGEAMAMEKPVVATDVGGVRELVGEAGTLLPAGNAEALAAAMLETMSKTDEERKQMGRSARERIEAKFSMDARVEEWEDLYQRASQPNDL